MTSAPLSARIMDATLGANPDPKSTTVTPSHTGGMVSSEGPAGPSRMIRALRR